MADFEIEGLAELQKKLDRLLALFASVAQDAMTEAVLVLEDAVAQRTPVAWGNLRGSITHKVTETPAEVTGLVGTSVSYAPAVEEGTAPHWPPLQPLVEWVHKLKLAGTYSVRSRQRAGGRARQQAEDVAVARAISAKIARSGTQDAYMFRDGLAASAPEILAIFDRAVDKLLDQL